MLYSENFLCEMTTMRIGIDFDNTLIEYDQIIHDVVVEQNLVPQAFPVNKSRIRDELRRQGKEDIWTEMQGYLYGVRIAEASPFAGVQSFLACCREKHIPICIISHKTRYPYKGTSYDLHKAATVWLESQGFFQASGQGGLSSSDVYYEPTKEDKVRRIANLKCTHFIDDLPEFLRLPGFPPHVQRILFDPTGIHSDEPEMLRVQSWSKLQSMLLSG